MSWMTEIADPATLRERTMKSLATPIGLANPLWLAFGAAASAGAAWWLMTRLARPFNVEAFLVTIPGRSTLATTPAAEPELARVSPSDGGSPAEAGEGGSPGEAPAASASSVPSESPSSIGAGEAAPALVAEVAPESAPALAETPLAEALDAANEVIEAEVAQACEVVAETQDDLTRLVGVGPRTAAALAERGVARFADLAAWTDEQLAAFDAELRLKGRSLRDAWRAQARRLADEG